MLEKGASKNKLMNALTLIMTARGIPITYYGTEHAMTGVKGDGGNREPLWPYFKKNNELKTLIKKLNLFRKKDVRVVELRGVGHLLREIDVRREVGGVDFELRADGTCEIDRDRKK